MKLLNVRLDEQDAKLVRELRSLGVSISDLMRQAIRSTHSSRKSPVSRPDISIFLEQMHEKYPDLKNISTTGIDLTDRREVRSFIRQQLSRKRNHDSSGHQHHRRVA